MKRISHTFLLPLLISALAQACSSCSSSPQPEVPVPDVASESVKEAMQEQQAAWDSVPPSAEESQWVKDINERMSKSAFKDLKDAELEQRLREWTREYRVSCDTAVFNRFKNALQDEIYQTWKRKNKTLTKELKMQMSVARDSCMAGKGE